MAANKPKEVQPGYTGECNPEIFNLSARPEIREKKPGQLPDETIRKFFEDGYVMVENFFTKEELEPCRVAIEKFVDQLAQKLHGAGKIKDLYKEYGFFERLSKIEEEFPGANIILHKYGVLPQAFKNLWTNDRLLNVVEQLIGPDIAGHPVWNLRTKTPQNEATTVPWHQDSAYLDRDSYTVLQPTAWIPLLDTDQQNGCMQVAHRGHKTGKVATHQCCYGNTWYVMLEEKEMAKSLGIDLEKDIITCPVPYGGMLLLNNMIPHRSLPNLSKQIRWSLDLRWQKPEKPAGFYGIREHLLFRTSRDPGYKIDWSSFEGDNRWDIQKEYVNDLDVLPNAEDKDFDTTIQGPWMKKWDLVNHNTHTAKMDDDVKSTWHGQQVKA
ncbi:phytanoyl-CoA dioxygenase domain-containing protein 1 [Magallana gigas]|uniref:phytanoyl-CoA dioxygenase domain-containing protein 1 n=1 Tax=Magallana gigas TaxID=29159 RepID=UPI0033403D2A